MWKSFYRYLKEKTQKNRMRRKKKSKVHTFPIDLYLHCREEKESVIEKAKEMFADLDGSGDGEVSQDEFVEGCMQDEDLARMLSEY